MINNIVGLPKEQRPLFPRPDYDSRYGMLSEREVCSFYFIFYLIDPFYSHQYSPMGSTIVTTTIEMTIVTTTVMTTETNIAMTTEMTFVTNTATTTVTITGNHSISHAEPFTHTSLGHVVAATIAILVIETGILNVIARGNANESVTENETEIESVTDTPIVVAIEAAATITPLHHPADTVITSMTSQATTVTRSTTVTVIAVDGIVQIRYLSRGTFVIENAEMAETSMIVIGTETTIEIVRGIATASVNEKGNENASASVKENVRGSANGETETRRKAIETDQHSMR